MKVHLIRKETIREFAHQNAQSRISFEEWLAKLKYANWEMPADIWVSFPSADFLGRGTSRVVFDIGGNKYRLIGKYAFGDKEAHLFTIKKRIFLFAGSARMPSMINYAMQANNIAYIIIKTFKLWKRSNTK